MICLFFKIYQKNSSIKYQHMIIIKFDRIYRLTVYYSYKYTFSKRYAVNFIIMLYFIFDKYYGIIKVHSNKNELDCQ